MNATMTYRMYKNEFANVFVTFVTRNFKVVDETAKVVTIEATEEQIEAIVANMFKSENEVKFDGFKTTEEINAEASTRVAKFQKAEFNAMYSIVIDYMRSDAYQTTGKFTEEIQDMYNRIQRYFERNSR